MKYSYRHISTVFGRSLLTVQLFAWPISAQRLFVSPDRIEATVNADTVPQGGFSVRIGSTTAGPPFTPVSVPFKANVPANGPRFVVISPAKGTTQLTVEPGISQQTIAVANGAIALDPNIVPFLPPGTYPGTFGYSLDLPGLPPGAGGFFTLRIRQPPPPVINAVLNAATFKPVISPGSVVSIFGTNIGSPAFSAKFDEYGVYSTTFGNATVTFNGIAAPLTYVSNTQINAIVPHELARQSSARVVLTHHDQQSAEFVLPIQETAPGIFTISQDGNGQGAFLQTPRRIGTPVTINSPDNPAENGGAIIIYATGAGLWNQDVRAGQVLFAPQGAPQILPKAEVSVMIGGKSALMLYAGGAPMMAGIMQVNAIVPEDLASGAQVVELKVGQMSNSEQQQVTVAVR